MKPNRKRLESKLVARHAPSIRAGLEALFNSEQILDAWYSLHHPIDNPNENMPAVVQSNMARSWLRTQFTPKDRTILNNALARLYADAWVFGRQLTLYDLARKVGMRKATPSRDDLAQALQTNWNNWKPGNAAAAALLKPPGGLQTLLSRRGVTIQGISNTTLDRIGTALAEGLEQGLSRSDIADDIDGIIDDSERALMIAGTEMRSAVVESSMDLYRDSGVEMVEWLVADPCDLCQENADQSPIGIDEQWINGQPPVHPNCRCDVAPYVVDTQGVFA